MYEWVSVCMFLFMYVCCIEIQHFVHHRKLSFPFNKSATAGYNESVVYNIIDMVYLCADVVVTSHTHIVRTQIHSNAISPPKTRFSEPLKTCLYMYIVHCTHSYMSPSMPFRPCHLFDILFIFGFQPNNIVFTCTTRTCTRIECLSMRKWFVLDGWMVGWLTDWLHIYRNTCVYVHRLHASVYEFGFFLHDFDIRI